ncbi:hypothetical protein [Actinomadura kijaniata]|uniref:hypothetical protein n=1 Tax=Actinomadura kijaniata TaxID=46161 RepID=UPI0008362F03|nr:hypothetical protein [Actinomadura kijaniata]
MAKDPGFGVRLTRLLNHRQTDVAWLASASGISESELRSVADGAPPSAAQLGNLAAALGFHTADLLVIAGLPVPEPLQPCEPAAGHELADLIHVAMALPAEQRTHIHQTVQQLPQLPRIRPADPPRADYRQDGGIGGMLVTMLCANRNLHSLSAATETLTRLTRGRMYLAASSLARIAAGLRSPLKPTWLHGFAIALGIPAADLAVITGIDLSEPPPPEDPLAAEMAQLLWNCRRLTASQIQHLHAEAKATLVAVPDHASSNDWNRVYRQHGTWWGAPRR